MSMPLTLFAMARGFTIITIADVASYDKTGAAIAAIIVTRRHHYYFYML